MSLGRYLRNSGRVAKKISWYTIHAGPRRDITVPTDNGLFTFDSSDAIIGKRLYVDHGHELPLIARNLWDEFPEPKQLSEVILVRE